MEDKFPSLGCTASLRKFTSGQVNACSWPGLFGSVPQHLPKRFQETLTRQTDQRTVTAGLLNGSETFSQLQRWQPRPQAGPSKDATTGGFNGLGLGRAAASAGESRRGRDKPGKHDCLAGSNGQEVGNSDDGGWG